MLISGDINEVTDLGVNNEQPYYYYVQALDTSPPTNQSLPSDPVQALPTIGHFGSYEYGENAATITITDKSNDTVLTDSAFIQGTIDKTGTLEVWVNGDYTQYPITGGSFDVSFELEVGRNDVTMYFEESGTGYHTRKTFNFVYLTEYDMVVDADTSHNYDVPAYETVQAAITAVPYDNDEPVVIFIRNGEYDGRVIVNKPFVSLIGEDSEETIIHYVNNTAIAGTLGGNMNERNVMKVETTAEDFTAENFTIENRFSYNNGANQQADALAVFADRAIFVNLRLKSFQNTLLVDSSGEGTIARQYFYKCYITGNLDFIYGRGTALFEDCDIVARYTSYKADGSYTAGRQESNIPYGFVFYDCRFLKENNIADDSYYLARPWGADAAVTFVNCFMDSHINDTGYGDMSSNFHENARFYEYYTYGPGFIVNNDRPLLSETEAFEAASEIFDPSSDGSDFYYGITLYDMYIPEEVNVSIILLIPTGVDEQGYITTEEYDSKYCEMGETVDLPNPTEPGYTFGGWYFDTEFTNGPFYEIATDTGDADIIKMDDNNYVYFLIAKFTEDTGETDDSNNSNNSNNNSSTKKEYPPIPPINDPDKANDTPDNTQEFTSKSGVTSTVTVTEEGVTVEAGLNESGSVNSESTAAAVKKAAEIAKANGETSVTVQIPEGATGLSKSTVKKLLTAADGMKITLALTSSIDGEKVGSISLPINEKTGQILTGLYFDTKRIDSAEDYIKKHWETDILGSFETAQKGGWGDNATLTVELDRLGFEADEETKLYALIYDTKTNKWYEVPAEIIDSNVVITTKRSGVVTIVTESVK
jgi:pectin methylesterase-like acyl-CoA thioesterase